MLFEKKCNEKKLKVYRILIMLVTLVKTRALSYNCSGQWSLK